MKITKEHKETAQELAIWCTGGVAGNLVPGAVDAWTNAIAKALAERDRVMIEKIAKFVETGKDFNGEIALMHTGKDVANAIRQLGGE